MGLIFAPEVHFSCRCQICSPQPAPLAVGRGRHHETILMFCAWVSPLSPGITSFPGHCLFNPRIHTHSPHSPKTHIAVSPAWPRGGVRVGEEGRESVQLTWQLLLRYPKQSSCQGPKVLLSPHTHPSRASGPSHFAGATPSHSSLLRSHPAAFHL